MLTDMVLSEGNSSCSFRPIVVKLYKCFNEGLKICKCFFEKSEFFFTFDINLILQTNTYHRDEFLNKLF